MIQLSLPAKEVLATSLFRPHSLPRFQPPARSSVQSHNEKGMKKHYAERDWARLERALLTMAEKLKDVLMGQGDGASDSTGAAAMAFCGDGI